MGHDKRLSCEIIDMARTKKIFYSGIWGAFGISPTDAKKDFLMKFLKDRERWTHSLFQAKNSKKAC